MNVKPGSDADHIDWRIALSYAIFGGMWILLSDRVLAAFIADVSRLSTLQTYKGWAFVALSALLIFSLMRRELALRRIAENELRESEDQYRLMAQNAEDMIWTMKLNLQLTYVSPAVERTLGYSAQEFLASTPERFLTPKSYAVGLKVFHEEVENARPQPDPNYARLLELEYCRKDGSTIWVETKFSFIRDAEGRPTRVLGVGRDITARKLAEEKLRQSEERYRLISENSADVIWVLDPLTGRFTYVSPSVEKLRGYTPAEVMAQPVSASFTPESQKLVEEALATLLPEFLAKGEGTASYVNEVDQPCKDGSIVHTEVITTAMFNAQGQVEILGVTRDITERRLAQEALRLSEEKYRAVVEEQTEFIVRWKPDGTRTFANDAYRRYFSLTTEQAVSASFMPLIAEEDRGGVEEKIARLMSGVTDSETEIHRVIRPDGSIGWQEWTDQAIRDASGQIVEFQSVGRDITERRLAEQKIEQQLRRLTTLRNIDQAIAGSMDLQYILTTVLGHVRTELGIDAAVILLYDPTEQTLKCECGMGMQTEALKSTRLKLGEGHAGKAALTRQTVFISDLQTPMADFLHSPAFSLEGFVCYFGIPLIAKGEIKGVMEIFHRSPLQPEQEWLDFMETLAGQVAIALDNASLYEELRRANLDLATAYDATIEGWSRALDLRDRETEGHTQRVTEMTIQLARAIGVSEEDILHIQRGALLHDIGKMGAPDRILLKPGNLTAEEWAIMRKHPTVAYEMLSPIAYLRPALDIPYAHHEKWDGSGYPRRLKGDQIPLAARLFAVVDVWDALTSDRPYRRAWSEEQALEYIQDQSGKHFDPKVVEAFLNVLSGRSISRIR